MESEYWKGFLACVCILLYERVCLVGWKTPQKLKVNTEERIRERRLDISSPVLRDPFKLNEPMERDLTC